MVLCLLACIFSPTLLCKMYDLISSLVVPLDPSLPLRRVLIFHIFLVAYLRALTAKRWASMVLACSMWGWVRRTWVAKVYHPAIYIFCQVQVVIWVARSLCLSDRCLLGGLVMVIMVYGATVGPPDNLLTLLLPYLLCDNSDDLELFTIGGWMVCYWEKRCW